MMNARYAGRRPPSRAPARPWTIEALAVASALATHPASGLSTAEASARLHAVGRNELLERRRVPPWRLLAGQFKNTMIVVLVIAAAVTTVIGDLKDSIIILTIVALNGVIGFVQEYRADRAMAALKEMTSPTARALRDGDVAVIAAGQLVPGDIIRLEAGDIVPADLRLLGPTSIRVNESALTGESEPATKTAEALPAVADGALGDQRNMAFKGTSVTYGRASGIVVATGMATALGLIADLMQQHETGPTPLQTRLSALGRGPRRCRPHHLRRHLPRRRLSRGVRRADVPHRPGRLPSSSRDERRGAVWRVVPRLIWRLCDPWLGVRVTKLHGQVADGQAPVYRGVVVDLENRQPAARPGGREALRPVQVRSATFRLLDRRPRSWSR
jgi:hypothetical protein